jgi:SAM-dependent methyltransferase
MEDAMVGHEEWKVAQQSEEAVWGRWQAEPIVSLQRRADLLAAYCLLDVTTETSTARWTLLEIGGAGAPVISFLPAERRIFVDPLLRVHRARFGDVYKEADKKNEYYAEQAEDLSFLPDDCVDLAFCLNVLDHVEDPDVVLMQLWRKLAVDGRLLLSVDCYSTVWLVARRLRMLVCGRNANDRLHPHHYTVRRLVTRVEATGFWCHRCFLAPSDGLTRASLYGRTREYPLERRWRAEVKRASRLYILVHKFGASSAESGL